MSKKKPVHEMSLAEVKDLLPKQRIAYLKKIYFDIPRQQDILTQIEECFEDNQGATEPQTMILEGVPRVGKSTIFEYFMEDHPSKVTKTGKIVPVLYALVIAPASPINLLTALLDAYGDPLAGTGTLGKKIYRFKKFVTDCRTNMIVLDEVHHFLHYRKSEIPSEVTDMFKVLIKDKNIACIFVGRKGLVSQVVKANIELDSLFPDAIVLNPFSWDESNPETIKEYRSLLLSIEELLPFNDHSDLHHKEMAWRIFSATSGVLGFTIRLIKHAAIIALRIGHESISIDDLKLSFDRKIAGVRWGINNPFKGDAPENKLPVIGEIDVDDGQNEDDNDEEAGLDDKPDNATNRRSRKRKDREEKISDFL